MESARADLYALMAETFSGAPGWFRLPAVEWPLYKTATRLAPCSPAAAVAAEQLALIPSEDWHRRQERYDDLFIGTGEPPFSLYESWNRDGALLGASTPALARLYQAAGLEIVGAELTGHASVELAFLSYLAGQVEREPTRAGKWRQLERQFVKVHAGCWLPRLGQALAASGDALYGPIGALLADWLNEVVHPPRKRRPAMAQRLAMSRPESCTLCGFCVQVCPAGALAILESARETTLLFRRDRCTLCDRCCNVCLPGALEITSATAATNRGEETGIMHRSPRATCRACSEPTVSQAELDFVRSRLGDADWLAYCHACRQSPPKEPA